MSQITQQQSDTLRLIARSPRDADGWSKCGIAVFEELIRSMPDSLVDQSDGKVRLTSEARVLLKWR